MNSIEPVLHSFGYCLDFLAEQVADVSEDDMVAQPDRITNHPAWVIGHLAFACQLLGSVIGLDSWLPSGWGRRFGLGSSAVPDPGAFESKEQLLVTLRDSQSRLADAVRKLNDTELDQPFPDESYRDVFPTVRHALTQVLVGHTANHIGQLSVWRRAMGLPPLKRGFQ